MNFFSCYCCRRDMYIALVFNIHIIIAATAAAIVVVITTFYLKMTTT